MKIVLAGFFLLILIPLSSAQTLMIGTTADSPPLASYADNKGNFYGFEIDMMLEVCKRIQAECKFQAIIVSDARQLLSEGKVNLILASIIAPPTPSPETAGFLFSIPYQASSAQFIVRNNSNINSLEDIPGKTVGTRLGSLFGGTLYKDNLLKLFDNDLTVKLYSSMNDLFAALHKQEIDAAFGNTDVIRFFYTNNQEQFKLIGNPIFIGNGFTIMGSQNDPNLMSQINQALFTMEKDGTLVQLYDLYFVMHQ